MKKVTRIPPLSAQRNHSLYVTTTFTGLLQILVPAQVLALFTMMISLAVIR
ncbi:MAG: hypothetical protein IPN60_02715 [Saprospiraceae bacterium]|nr:hypothetical protein [Candidatus Opimibacter skivensis]